MLERLQNHVVFLYQRQDLNIATKEVGWNILRRIEYFSTDMADFSYFNYCFTPNLQHYIDYSKADNKYMIRRSIDQSLLMDIPQGFFSTKAEEPECISKRFMFVSNTRFKLVSKDSLEEMYDFTDFTRPP